MERFFISCPLYFEKDLIAEISSFWHLMCDLDGMPTREPIPEFFEDMGGVEIKCPLHLGLQINFFSHIALRVLLRIGKFNARFFDQFEKEVKKVSFEKYISPTTVRLDIDSAKSRLFHENNLLESAEKLMTARGYKVDSKSPLSISFRIFKDECTVSVNTSGEHLHFRGYRQLQGEAPIRENLASLMIQKLGLDRNKKTLIVDPFCGAGTLLFETALVGEANFYRDYSFLHFNNCPALFKSASWKKNYRWLQFKNTDWKLLGIEKDEATFEKAEKNLAHFKENFIQCDMGLINGDSFEVLKKEVLKQSGGVEDIYLVMNPPYGERISNVDVSEVVKQMKDVPQFKGALILHPIDWTQKPYKDKFKVLWQIPFSNQGLNVKLALVKNN